MLNYQAVIKMNKKLQSSLLLILATAIWGTTFVAQSVGMAHIGPFTFQAVRCALGGIGLLPVIAFTDRFQNDGKTFLSRWADKKLWLGGFLCSIPLFLACNLQQLGIVDTDAGKSAFLTAMYIVIVPIIGIFRKRIPSPLIPVSLILAIFGLYFLCGTGISGIALADLLLLGCALAFAVQITVVDIFAPQTDALRLNAIQAVLCAVFSAMAMFPTEQPQWSQLLDCWLPLCYAGFLSMGAAYSLQIVGQKHLEPSSASLIMSLESVFAVLSGCLILGEKLTVWEAVGCLLIFGAVILSQVPIKHKSKSRG